MNTLILTFDLEPRFCTLPSIVPTRSWGCQSYSFERLITLRILNLLDVFNAKATFFVVGLFAELNKDLIQLIYERGHEIGSHTLYHENLSDVTSDQFFYMEKKNKLLLENIIGSNVRAFRAPDLNLGKETLQKLSILAELGYTLDCSASTFKRKKHVDGIQSKLMESYVCGYRRINRFAVNQLSINGSLVNASGGNFRLISERKLSKISHEGEYHTYLHPHDFERSTDYIKSMSLVDIVKRNIFFGSSYDKLTELLRYFDEYVTVSEFEKRMECENLLGSHS